MLLENQGSTISFLGEGILKLFINNKKKVHNEHVRLDALFGCYSPESSSAMAVPPCLLAEEGTVKSYCAVLCSWIQGT